MVRRMGKGNEACSVKYGGYPPNTFLILPIETSSYIMRASKVYGSLWTANFKMKE
jgi:hypothetical protein